MENEARRATKYLGKLVVEAANMEKQELQLVVENAKNTLIRILKDATDENLRGPKLAAKEYLEVIIQIVEDKRLEVEMSNIRGLLAQFEDSEIH